MTHYDLATGASAASRASGHLSSWAWHHPILAALLVFIGGPIALGVGWFAWLVSKGGARWVRLHILRNDPFQFVPRPKVPFSKWTLVVGDMTETAKEEMGVKSLQWSKECGSYVYCPRGLFYSANLQIVDPVAMNAILGSQHVYDWPKPESSRNFLIKLLGRGLVAMEGHTHQNQRKMISPAFSTGAIRDLTPLFFTHGKRIVARLGEMVDATEGPADKPIWPGQTAIGAEKTQAKQPVLDLSYWLSRTTLDVIGQAGFGTDWNTIAHKPGERPNALAETFKSLLKETSNFTLPKFLLSFLAEKLHLVWLVDKFRPDAVAMQTAHDRMMELSAQVVADKKKQIYEEIGLSDGAKPGANGRIAKSQYDESMGKKVDVLHLLMRHNLAADVKEHERMTDDELLGQMATMIFAGHETTATTMGWLLQRLAQHKDMQDRLRAELRDFFAGRDELSYDELNQLPYLDACLREILRVVPAVFATVRQASKDTVLPLSKPYPRSDGKGTFNSLTIKKGQSLSIPLFMLNMSHDIWGPDAEQFNPDRWTHLPPSATGAEFPPPVNHATFLMGARTCIGNRFAFAEMKAIVASLLLELEFDLVPGFVVKKKQSIVTQSIIEGQEDAGIQQPLYVSRVKR